MMDNLCRFMEGVPFGYMTCSGTCQITGTNQFAAEMLNGIFKAGVQLIQLHPDLQPEGDQEKEILLQDRRLRMIWRRVDFSADEVYAVCLIDITDEERTRSKLFSLIQILDSIDEGIMASDEVGKIFVYNQAAERLEGLLRTDIVGRHSMEIWGGEGKSSDHNLILQSGKPILKKFKKIATPEGGKIDLVLNKFPVFKEGKTVAAYSIIRDVTKLRKLVDYNVSLQQKINNNQMLRTTNNTSYAFPDIVGKSEGILTAIEHAHKAARANCSILVIGETGTGKELFVQSIHNDSARGKEPFIPINCAAIPDTLLEGMLFGTVKGAFTGSTDNAGLFEQAGSGTLFLDEINSMKIDLQAKMLRVLQEKKIRRVGGKNEIPVDCRIISSMNVDPVKCMECGSLRSDLYYRLAGLSLYIPPLRERKEDIEVYIDFFISRFKQKYSCSVLGVSDKLMNALKKYDWPGNVRELEHFIESAINMVEGDEKIDFEHLPTYLHDKMISEKVEYSVKELSDTPKNLNQILWNVEKNVVEEVLKTHGGNITLAAKTLGMGRQNLHYRMNKLGIRSQEYTSNGSSHQ